MKETVKEYRLESAFRFFIRLAKQQEMLHASQGTARNAVCIWTRNDQGIEQVLIDDYHEDGGRELFSKIYCIL